MSNLVSSLRQVIIIQKSMISEHGDEIWKDFLVVRAEVNAVYDKKFFQETFFAMQLIDNAFYSFKVRFDPRITSNMRINYNGKYFYIKRIINVNEMNKVLTLFAQENL